MPSLRELQRCFAAAVLAPAGAAPGFAIAGRAPAADRIGIYRNAVFANYRNALRASFPVVLRLVGEPFFNAAVDAFVQTHPSVSGDLNVYGDAFGDFLGSYPMPPNLPYLADVARLDGRSTRRSVRPTRVCPRRCCGSAGGHAAGASAVGAPRLDPSCRLVASDFPILRIWQANQPGHENDDRCAPRRRRGPPRRAPRCRCVVLARIGAGAHAFLRRWRRMRRSAPRSTPRNRPMQTLISAPCCGRTLPPESSMPSLRSPVLSDGKRLDGNVTIAPDIAALNTGLCRHPRRHDANDNHSDVFRPTRCPGLLRLAGFIDKLQSLFALALRLYVGRVFFVSG